MSLKHVREKNDLGIHIVYRVLDINHSENLYYLR